MYSKEDAGMKTAKLRDEKEVLDRQQHADLEAQKNLEENLQQLRSREAELEEQEEQMLTRQKKIKENSAKHRDEAKNLDNELRAMQSKNSQARLFSSPVCFSILCIYVCVGSGRCILLPPYSLMC